MKKLIIWICVLCLVSSQTLAASMPSVTAPAAVLANSLGEILVEKNAAEQYRPASVTKIMTMLLVIEALEDGRISLDDEVTASEHAAGMGGSQIYLEAGEKMTVRDLLKSVAISSANDAAVALGEHVAGNEESFVAMMNERAARLSMNNTNFVNCCGLDEEGHLTTAKDIALMSAELMKHPMITEFTTIWMDSVRDGKFGLDNTNKLLKSFKGTVGLKTGSTSKAKFCLSAVAGRDGLMLIAVVLSAPSSAERFADATAILNYGFANYQNVNASYDERIPPVRVILGKKKECQGEIATHPPLTIEKIAAKNISKSVTMTEDVKAPVEKGQKIGEFIISMENNVLFKAPVVARERIEALTLFDLFMKLLTCATMRE